MRRSLHLFCSHNMAHKCKLSVQSNPLTSLGTFSPVHQCCVFRWLHFTVSWLVKKNADFLHPCREMSVPDSMQWDRRDFTAPCDFKLLISTENGTPLVQCYHTSRTTPRALLMEQWLGTLTLQHFMPSAIQVMFKCDVKSVCGSQVLALFHFFPQWKLW